MIDDRTISQIKPHGRCDGGVSHAYRAVFLKYNRPMTDDSSMLALVYFCQCAIGWFSFRSIG